MNLTREEIMHMPAGREMDALIATQVFGHEVKRDTVLTTFVPVRVDTVEWSEGFTTLAHYSTDIEAAWEVVGKMIKDSGGKDNKFMLYRFGFGVKKPRIRWRVSFGKGFENLLQYIDAETAPLAICRAALLHSVTPKK